MIDKLIFKFGAAEGSTPLAVDITPVTVFVGPNNSGKSKVLIELENFCRHTYGQQNDLLLSNVKFSPYTKSEIETELQKIEQEPNFGEVSHQSFHNQPQAIFAALQNTGKDMKRDGGIEILQGQDKEAAQNFLSQLRDYGVFVVPGGELESWLKPLGAVNHGPAWLIDVFQKMGEDPEAASYILPSKGDVWDFVGQIKSWINDPQRKGVPI
ncbi:MAG: hypothetical protein WBQ69_00435 [Gallionella sp.]